jgi:RHS repeat-associated protein
MIDIMKHKNIFTVILLVSSYQLSWCQSADQNYIRTRTMTDKEGSTYIERIQYFDGLGRPVQTVQRGITPAGKDLVSYQEYDALGRESNAWLPAPVGQTTGNFMSFTSFQNTSKSFYNDNNPHTKPVYEASPLNRITAQYGAGAAWHNAGKAVKTEYLTNTTSGELSCLYYTVQGSGLSTTIKKAGIYFPSKQLYVTKITDEDGNIAYEFKDKLGQVLLTRQKDNTLGLIDTYYVYDDFGNQCYVLQPEFIRQYGSLSTGYVYSDTHAGLKGLAFIYRYDSRNRCIYKKMPGADPIYYVYDKADRLIFSQDGEQRQAGKWMFAIPDALGRTSLTGHCSNTIDYAANPLGGIIVCAARTNSTNTYKGYSISGITLASPRIFTVNYYDDYEFMGFNNFPSKTDANFKYETVSNYGTQYKTDERYCYKGKLTGTMTASIFNLSVNNPEDLDVITLCPTVMYYDERGRVIRIQTRKGNVLISGYEKDYFAYNFKGQLTSHKSVHTVTYSSAKTQTEFYTYTYDHAGRLIDAKHKLEVANSGKRGTTITLSHNTYDELGRLKTAMPNDQQSLKLTYSYNVRNWLTEIAGQAFGEKLYYNTAFAQGGTARWNGNISTAIQYDGDYGIGFNYRYDNLNRLTNAVSFYGNNNFNYISFGAYDSHYSFDKNGNMTKLWRIEDLALEDVSSQYNGNLLSKRYSDYFEDEWENTYGDYYDVYTDYTHGDRQNAQMTYNKNGALTSDPYRGVNYGYNTLGMPRYVTVPAVNGSIRYCYSAIGEKQCAVYYWHSGLSLDPLENEGKNYTGTNSNKTINYFNNKVYENGVLKKILLPNGYIFNDTYYFYLRDHLGNNCAVANAKGSIVQRTYYHPYGKPIQNGESTGTATQPYLYGGKERETMMGINNYDFTARTLDEYGRFTTQDPLAEKYPWISQYAYCLNNPVNNIDPDGRKVYFAPGVSQAFKSQFTTAVQYLNEKGAAGMLAKLHASDGVYYIAEGHDRSNFSYTKNTINWDPDLGLLTNEDIVMSPTSVLNHEIDHALQYDTNRNQFLRDVGTPEDDYRNLEEKRVITGSEQTTARKLGEIGTDKVTRTDHKGILYETKGVKSTEGKNETTVTPNNKQNEKTWDFNNWNNSNDWSNWNNFMQW